MQKLRIILATLLLASASLIAADEYKIDSTHSFAVFSLKHNVISTATGRFTEVTGTIVYNEADVSKSSVTADIKVATINTDSPARDKHLKSPDFFDADKYPDITFVSKRVEKRGEGYVAIGTLTMKGVSKEIELPFSIGGKIKDPRGGTRLGAEAHLTLNRQDYGVSWNRAMEGGGVIVGNEVKIDLNIEALKPLASPSGEKL